MPKLPKNIGRGYILVAGTYKVGDPEPEGYIDRQEWAQVHLDAGLKQHQCGICCLWQFPHQLSDRVLTTKAFTSRGKEVILKDPVCLKCAAK